MSSLNIATSALTANMAAMQVIGQNIANVNTPGYSRQNALQSQVLGQQSGSGYFGKGVLVEDVRRSYDIFLTKEANATSTAAASDSTRSDRLKSIESLFPLGEGGLGDVLNKALNAWGDVASNPSDTTARSVLLGALDTFAGSIKNTFSRLDDIRNAAQLQMREEIKKINDLSESIAKVNQAVSQARGAGGSPNDLLDQRDRLIARLNELVKVSTIDADDGSVSVFVAGSYPLVLGSGAAKLSVIEGGVEQTGRQKLVYSLGGSAITIKDEFIGGGVLDGLQKFINQDISSVESDLGRMALALASAVNRQQVSGLTLNGQPGPELFSYGTMRTVNGFQERRLWGNGLENASGQLYATISDLEKLIPEDLEVTLSGGDVSVRRLSDGLFVQSDGSWSSQADLIPNTSGGIGSIIGLNFQEATSANGAFVFRIGADVGKTLATSSFSPKEVAAASRVQIKENTPNSGGASVEFVGATAINGQWPAGVFPANLTFSSPDQFSLDGFNSASLTFTPGVPMIFTINDALGGSMQLKVTLRGYPKDGDTFTLSESNGSAPFVKFDGGNAKAMLDLRDALLFDGVSSLSDGYLTVFSKLASKIGVVQSASRFSIAQAQEAETRRANQSGVNLDEEAARLLQYQQAYQAAAKYMQTTQSIFDTLLSAFR
jgi:flagellar hook-associated protein 1